MMEPNPSLEDRVKELARLLGIAVGEQLHRALQVSEEDGHLLALTLDRLATAQDAAGEMTGRIGVGRAAGRGARRRRGERLTASPAELAVDGHDGAAGRTGVLEACPAFLAEAGA